MRLCAPGRKPKTIQHKYFAPDPYLSTTVEGVDCSDETKQIVSQDQHYDRALERKKCAGARPFAGPPAPPFSNTSHICR